MELAGTEPTRALQLRAFVDRITPPQPAQTAPRCSLRSLTVDAERLARLTRSPDPLLVLVQDSVQVRVGPHAGLVANPCGVLLLNPGQPLECQAVHEEGAALDVVTLRPGFAAQLARMAGMPVDSLRDAAFATPWTRIGPEDVLALRRMQQRPAAAGGSIEPQLAAWAQRVVLTAASEWKRRPVPQCGTGTGNESSRHALAQSMAAHLDRNWRRGVSLQELSEEFDLSSFHLLRVFRREIGLTPHQYTLQLRLRRSLRLLESARGRLIDVAIALGFSSHAHFTTTFRTCYGLTPAEYLGARRPAR